MAEEKRFIEYMPLGTIKAAPNNPKLHEAGVIGASLKRFGQVESPMLDDRTGRLVAGHGRIDVLKALKARGKKPPPGVQLAKDGEWLVPVQRGWASKDDTEARAYVVTSNKSSEVGGWDEDKLAAELAAIADDSALSLVGVGFDDTDLSKLLGTDEGTGRGKKRPGAQGNLFQVLVEVDSEEAQAKLIDRLEKEGFTTCTGWAPALAARAAGLKPTKCIGYDNGPKDSRRAVGTGEDEDFRYRYPLREWHWDREECVRQIAAEGLPVPVKSACFFCPASKPWELLVLAARHPELLIRALRMEDNARNGRHGLKTVAGLWRKQSWRAWCETQGIVRGDTVVMDRAELEARIAVEKPTIETAAGCPL